MVKAVGFGILAVVLYSGCSGRKVLPDHGLPLSMSKSAARETTEAVEKLDRNLGYLISDLGVSADGSRALVATVPYAELGGGSGYWASAYDRGGKAVWKYRLPSPLKQQAISEDGALAVVSTYDEKMTAIGPKGDALWSVDGVCAPVILERTQRVLCYHDDDAEPDVAFDAYDWSGKKLLSFPIANDILSLKKSGDDGYLILGLTRGQVILIGPDFRPVWQRRVRGEIADVAVSSGPNPHVVVLTSRKGLVLFDRAGKVRAQGSTSEQSEQVEISDDGAAVAVYGSTSDRGQYVGLFSGDLKARWQFAGSHEADYSPQMQWVDGLLYVGFEDLIEGTRHYHLLGLTPEGVARVNLPFDRDQNLYLHGQGKGTIAAATDNGDLRIYELK